MIYVCAKAVRIGLAASLFLGMPLSSGYAFQLEAAKARQEMVANLAAFNSEPGGKAGPRALLLTQNEVKHIRWCVLQDPSYHATDNTILGEFGNRRTCVSPMSGLAGQAGRQAANH